MSTFLQLCRRVHRYARIGEDAPGTAPETVAGQDGVLAEIVGWVQDAYEDIQLDQEAWRFREAIGEVPVVMGSRDVDVATTLADFDTLRMATADACARYILVDTGSANLQMVWFVEWEQWRGGMYDRSGATGTPSRFTVLPNGKLRLYPTPDADVSLQLTYQRVVQELAEDGDVPILPEGHHTAIVWRALMYYVDTRDKTQEPYQKWERRRKQAMRRLYRDQLPEMSL